MLAEAAAAAVLAAAGGGELLPDLVTRPPANVHVRVTKKGRRLLRFANEVVNAQTGPLELHPRAGDCNGNGDRADDRFAYQRIYRDASGDGVFTRSVDTAFRERPAGCVTYHREHAHWHFEAFAEYRLRAYARDGSLGPVVVTSGKVSSCVIDTKRRLRLPGAPARAYYGPLGGTGCRRDSVGGISVGWGDRYGARVTGQHLELTGLPGGAYCLVLEADPEDRIVEANERNNVRRTYVVVRGDAVVRLGGRPC